MKTCILMLWIKLTMAMVVFSDITAICLKMNETNPAHSVQRTLATAIATVTFEECTHGSSEVANEIPTLSQGSSTTLEKCMLHAHHAAA